MKADDLYNRKRLDRAFTVSIVGLVGCIVPIVGVILALVAMGINTGVEPTTNKMKTRKDAVYSICIISIILAILAGFGFYQLYNNHQKDLKTKATAQQEALDREKQLDQTEEYIKSQNLNECVAKVNQWYNDNSGGLHPQAYWDNLLASKQQQIKECELLYK